MEATMMNNIYLDVYNWIEEFHVQRKYADSLSSDETYAYIFNRCMSVYNLPGNYINHIIRTVNVELMKNPFSSAYRRFITGRTRNEIEYQLSSPLTLNDVIMYFSGTIKRFRDFHDWCNDLIVVENLKSCDDTDSLVIVANCIRNLVPISNTDMMLIKDTIRNNVSTRIMDLLYSYNDVINETSINIYITNIVDTIMNLLLNGSVDINTNTVDEMKIYIFSTIDRIVSLVFESSWISSYDMSISEIKRNTLYDIFGIVSLIITDIIDKNTTYYKPDAIVEMITLCYDCINMISDVKYKKRIGN